MIFQLNYFYHKLRVFLFKAKFSGKQRGKGTRIRKTIIVIVNLNPRLSPIKPKMIGPMTAAALAMV
tara:strand:+ start:1635 stop:1832 length:198 start_codon:yes stop_codon:yes gene_type:complete